MTPEEKQAIIDKALELGFRKIDTRALFIGYSFYSYQIGEEKILVINDHPKRIYISIVCKNKRDRKLDIISKEQLETLFNHETKRKTKRPNL